MYSSTIRRLPSAVEVSRYWQCVVYRYYKHCFLNETVTHHRSIMYLQLLNIKYKSRMYRLRNYKQYKRLPTLGYEMTSFHVRQSGKSVSKGLCRMTIRNLVVEKFDSALHLSYHFKQQLQTLPVTNTIESAELWFLVVLRISTKSDSSASMTTRC